MYQHFIAPPLTRLEEESTSTPVQTETMCEKGHKHQDLQRERYVKSNRVKRSDKVGCAPRPSNRGVGVARGAAVADGRSTNRGGKDVLSVVLWGLRQRVEYTRLDNTHHRVRPIF